MARRFGVSVISLLPYSLGPHGLSRSIEIAKSAGLDGVQALPLHGWEPKTFPNKGVISIEQAWDKNNQLYSDDLKNFLLFDRQYRSFYIYTKLFFKYSYAIKSSHELFSEPTEIHPELNISEEGILRGDFPVVLDTFHIRRPGLNGESPITSDPERLISGLGKRIKLIHLRLEEKEEEDLFLQRETSDIVKIVRYLNLHTNCDVILELMPKLHSKTQMIRRLRGLYLASTRYLH